MLLILLSACGTPDYGVCPEYIACSEALGASPPAETLRGLYGEDGSCWGSKDAADCQDECSDLYADLQSEYGEICDIVTSDNPYHPNAPSEEYWNRWSLNLECSGGWGETGDRVYALGEGSVDAEGNFTATETWYWFYGGNWDEDHVDVLSYSGTRMSESAVKAEIDPADEGFALVRSVVSQESGSFGDDREMDFFMDSVTYSGTLNQDNKVLIYRGTEGWGGKYDVSEYSDANRSYYWPEGEILGPATYEWEMTGCY